MYDSRLIWREPVILVPSVLSIGGFGELGELGELYVLCSEAILLTPR